MQLDLDEQLNKITVEFISFNKKMENANEKVFTENAEMEREIKDLKLQLIEQQSVINELQFVTESCPILQQVEVSKLVPNLSFMK